MAIDMIFPDLHRNERAVSEVVGVILIVGLVTLLIAISTPVILEDLVQESPPNADFEVHQSDEYLLLLYSNGNYLSGEQLEILINGHVGSEQFDEGLVRPGDRIKIPIEEYQGIISIMIFWEGDSSNSELIYEDEFFIKST